MSTNLLAAAANAAASAANAEVGRLQGALSGMGSRPLGDPEALRALARKLNRLGDEARDATRAVPAAMHKIKFEGSGGDRLRANSDHMGQAGGPAASDLHNAAGSANTDAQKLEDQQTAYDLKKVALAGALEAAKGAAAIAGAAARAASSK